MTDSKYFEIVKFFREKINNIMCTFELKCSFAGATYEKNSGESIQFQISGCNVALSEINELINLIDNKKREIISKNGTIDIELDRVLFRLQEYMSDLKNDIAKDFVSYLATAYEQNVPTKQPEQRNPMEMDIDHNVDIYEYFDDQIFLSK